MDSLKINRWADHSEQASSWNCRRNILIRGVFLSWQKSQKKRGVIIMTLNTATPWNPERHEVERIRGRAPLASMTPRLRTSPLKSGNLYKERLPTYPFSWAQRAVPALVLLALRVVLALLGRTPVNERAPLSSLPITKCTPLIMHLITERTPLLPLPTCFKRAGSLPLLVGTH